MILPPYTPGRYFVPGSNFVAWNGKAAREQKQNGVGLAPKIFIKLAHSGMSENAPFKRDEGYLGKVIPQYVLVEV